jgi:hypothetical protein
MVLVKEFRIQLPMPVEEYQIGQLYSVAKSSSQETSNGEGVEVLKNEPFKNEQDGLEGQYTEKIYHVGSRLPGWIKAFIPGSALKLEEKAWNAYPYCKTVLKNGWMGDSFTFIIESRHYNDDGKQENVHNLPPDQLRKREVDFIDIAADKVDKKDYKKEEDPTLVKSEKAERGPLTEGWKDKKPLMTCYKLVSVEFKLFGFQGRVEKFLQTFERDLFLKFHRQVYCWMDEWHGMSLEDVRNYETKTKADLDNKLKAGDAEEGEPSGASEDKKEEKKK